MCKYLEAPNNSAVKELAKTPLLLTFICIFFERKQEIPSNRGDLYRHALDIVLNDWGAEKFLNKPKALIDLQERYEKGLLQKIAFDGFTKDSFKFSRAHLENEISKYITTNIGNNKKNLYEALILDGMIEYQGIFKENPGSVYYSFSHFTFQEFLAAKHAAEYPDAYRTALEGYILKYHWRELFILLSGLLPQSDNFLLEIESITQNYTRINENIRYFSARLQALVSCGYAKSIRKMNSRKSFSVETSKLEQKIISLMLLSSLFVVRSLLSVSAIKRDQGWIGAIIQDDKERELELSFKVIFTFVNTKMDSFSSNAPEMKSISNAIWRFAFSLSDVNRFEECLNESIRFSRKMMEYGIFSDAVVGKLKNTFKSIRRPRKDSPIENKQKFVITVQNKWFKLLGINPDRILSDVNNIHELCNYLNLNILMLECIHSAAFISPSVKLGIPQRIFESYDI